MYLHLLLIREKVTVTYIRTDRQTDRNRQMDRRIYKGR